MATRDYLNDLIKNFNTQNLISLFYELSSDFAQLEDEIENIRIPHFQVPLLVGSLLVGKDKLCVVSSKLDIQLTERSSKKAQFDFARKFLRNELTYSGGFFVFYDEFGNFRFSFIHKEITKAGREEYSNFKRYTYFVEKDKPNKTFRAQLTGIKFTNINEIKQAFSLEYVTKLFYEEIAILFSELVGGERSIRGKKITYPGVLKYPTGENTDKREFAVRLIGRLLFSWFLKKKKSIQGNPLVSDEILSSQSVRENDNFYHSILEVLFFEIFNTENRRSEFNQKRWNDIPFLNGGLFEPILKDFYKRNEITNFSEYHNTLVVPDEWILKLIALFEQYNFTIDESSTNDMDLAIDPEMLGRIFENLLAEINEETAITARKATGSFYTPREIVEYMVSESLIAYLKSKLSDTDDAENKLRSLLSNSDEPHKFTVDEVYDIIEALDEMKILDPACGSGAFPMGIVHKVQTILEKVDENGKLWLEKVLYGIKDISFKKTLQHKLQNQPDLVNYSRKLGIIQKTIYGVDLQEIAVEISRLRCFLTIVVDEKVDENEKNKGIAPLPNLDFKFIAANSLISINTSLIGNELFSTTMKEVSDKLTSIRDEYFDTSFREKDKLKEEFLLQINKIKSFVLDNKNNIRDNTRYELLKLSEWNPFAHQKTDWFDPEWMFGIQDGFDIVIGNPPYIQLQKDGGALAKQFEKMNYQTFAKTGDIYALFYEKGTNLLDDDGHLCFITSNKWMRADYGEKLREFFTYHNPQILIDLGPGVFESATVDTNILLIKKGSTNFAKDKLKQNKEKKFNLKALTLTKVGKSNFSIENELKNNGVIIQKLTKDAWTISGDIEMRIKEKIERIGTPLKDWDINIYRGVLTGFNEAFIIDGKKKDELIAADPKNAEIIKPILRGRDIKRYKAEFADLWIIFIPWHFPLHKENISGNSEKAEKAFQNDYPAIYNHLLNYKIQLSNRNKAETGITYEWYALQRCANTYYEEFEKEKIVWNRITSEIFYSFAKKNMFVLDSTFFITECPYKYFLSLLNSKLIKNWIKQNAASLGDGIYGAKIYIEKLPIPKISLEEQQPFIDLVDIILKKKENNEDTTAEEREIDQMVYKLYELTEEEIKIVEDV